MQHSSPQLCSMKKSCTAAAPALQRSARLVLLLTAAKAGRRHSKEHAVWPELDNKTSWTCVQHTLRVKVMARMDLADTPCCSSQPTRAATTRVLPLPGPAITRKCCSCATTASRCSALKLLRKLGCAAGAWVSVCAACTLSLLLRGLCSPAR